MDSWVELIPVVYLHPSYGRRIEYQQGILWENFGMAIFDQKGHFGAILENFHFSTKLPSVGILDLCQEMPDIMKNKYKFMHLDS